MSRLTDGNESESKKLPRLLKGSNTPKRIYRDGACDTKKCYQAILDKGLDKGTTWDHRWQWVDAGQVYLKLVEWHHQNLIT